MGLLHDECETIRGSSLEALERVRSPRWQKILGFEGKSTSTVIWGICDTWSLSDQVGGMVTLPSVTGTGEGMGPGLKSGETGEQGLGWEGVGGTQAGRTWGSFFGHMDIELAGKCWGPFLRV